MGEAPPDASGDAFPRPGATAGGESGPGAASSGTSGTEARSRKPRKPRKARGDSALKSLTALLPTPRLPSPRVPARLQHLRSGPWFPVFGRLPGLLALVGERAFELVTALLVLVLVERTHGEAGLGVYSYLLSAYTLTGILAEWGLPHLVERETALRVEHPASRRAVLAEAYPAALAMSLLVAGGYIVSSLFDASFTRVDENVVAYGFLGVALLFRTCNRLRVAALNGEGRHGEAAALHGKKRLCFLAVVAVLLLIRVRPSLLVLSFVFSEAFMALAGRRKLKLPPLASLGGGVADSPGVGTDRPRDACPREDAGAGAPWPAVSPGASVSPGARIRRTLREGSRYLFTDETLDAILYIDLLILGFFMTSTEVGIYAEASVFARFFLLVPTSLRPAFRRRACVMASEGDASGAVATATKTAARIFAFQAFPLVALILFQPSALRFLFVTAERLPLSLEVFEIFAPGLLLAGSALVLEPLYEASGRSDSLRARSHGVLVAAALLNATFVPLAGLHGAAVATMLCMTLHFLLVAGGIDRPHRPRLTLYALAGGGVFLAHGIMASLGTGFRTTLVLLPVLLGVFFYVIGFLNDANNLNGAKTGCSPENGG